MQQELFNQVIEMFDTPEKWNDYLELSSQRETIQKIWYGRFWNALNEHFKKEENKVKGWAFNQWGWNAKWYLESFDDQIVSLWLDGNLELSLYQNSQIDKISAKLKEPRYAPILDCFERKDSLFQEQWRIVSERRNFHFGDRDNSAFDGNFGDLKPELLMWYAGNKTDMLVSQVVAKVDKFRRDEKVTALLHEVNELTKT